MQLPSMRVDGKIALVTGAGSGRGEASGGGWAQAGADVALTELPGREAAAAQTVQFVESAGRRAVAWPLDVTRVSTIAEVVNDVVARFGRIDILVNNAGINVPRLALDVTEDDWDRVLDVNLKGAFFVAQAVARAALVPQQGGKLITIVSQTGVVGMHHRAASFSSNA